MLYLQGPVRDAVAACGAAVAGIAESDLRPVKLRDFQVSLPFAVTTSVFAMRSDTTIYLLRPMFCQLPRCLVSNTHKMP